jgi:GGDEF domain-containing protein
MLREAGEAATSACVGRLLGDLQMLAIGAIRGLSVSAGVALFGPEDEDPVSLFESAGRALADAQAAGGGRAAIASADALEALAIAMSTTDSECSPV